MKKFLIVLASLFLTTSAYAAELQRYQAGPRLIDGTQLNQMVDAINSGLTCPSFNTIGNAGIGDTTFFVATRAMKVKFISQVHSVAAGSASTVQITKDTGTTAPGAGTALLSTAFNLNATANTVQVGALVGTAGVTSLAAGNRLGLDFSTTVLSSQNITITACMAPN